VSSRKGIEFQTYTAIKPSPKMLARIQSVVEECVKACVDKELEKVLGKIVDEKLPKIVRKCLEEQRKEAPSEVIKLKKISKKEAIEEVQAYIDSHPGCLTSDIIHDLALDPDLVLNVLKELEKSKTVRGESFE